VNDDFDVGRIVPSMRDLVAGLAMRRRALSLVPLLDGDEPTLATDVARLDGVVRAFASSASSAPGGDAETLRRIARAIGNTPLLALAPHATALDCQRSRYFGADGVALAPEGRDVADVSGAARSMHMMPLAVADETTPPERLASAEGGAWLVRGTLPRMHALAAALPKKAVVVACGSAFAMNAQALRDLAGVVDAVVVSSATHRAAWFCALVDELDG